MKKLLLIISGVIISLPLIKLKWISNTTGDYYDTARIGLKFQIYDFLTITVNKWLLDFQQFKQNYWYAYNINQYSGKITLILIILLILIQTILFKIKLNKSIKLKKKTLC